MSDHIIPCETVARFSKITDGSENPWLGTIRIENGIAIASNKRLMAVEYIGGVDGVIHINMSPALVQQCIVEASLSSMLTVSVLDGLNIAGAKTTMGYTFPGDPCLWSANAENLLDRWREIVNRSATPAEAPNGAMFWSAAEIATLASVAPSGRVMFEEIIDVNRPALMRDPSDPNWLGVFPPYPKQVDFPGATLPAWVPQ